MALNQAAINVEVINGYPPAVLYFKNVIASSTTISSFLKRTGAIRKALSTSVATLVRGVRKRITYTSTSTASIRKAITQTARSVISTSTAKLLRRYFRLLNGIVVTSTATLRKAVGKLVVASQSTTSTISRAVRKILSVSDATVSNIVKRVSKRFSVSSTSIASIKKAATRTLSVISTTIAKVIKKVLKTFIVKGTKTLMTGTLNGPIFNERALNTDDPTYTETTGVTSTATVSVNSFYYKLLTILSTSVNTLSFFVNKLRTLTVNVTSSVTKLSLVFKELVTDILVSIATVFKIVGKLLVASGTKTVMTGTLNGPLLNERALNTDDPTYTETTGITSTATVSVNALYYRLFTVLSTSINTITRAITRLKVIIATIVVSSSSLLKSVSKLLYTFVSNLADTFKQIQLILITYGNKYVMTGGLNGLSLNELTINEEAPATYILAPGVYSTATVSVISIYYKVLVSLVTSINSLVIAFIKLKVLVANAVISTVRVFKQANLTLVAFVSSVIDTVKQIKLILITLGTRFIMLGGINGLTLNDLTINDESSETIIYTSGVNSTATLLTNSFFFKVLSVLSTSIALVNNLRAKVLETLVTSYLTITTNYGKLLVTVVSSFSSLILNFVYFAGLLSKIYIYAEDRVRSLSVEKLRVLTEDDRLRFLTIKKLRTVLTEKIRTVFITKDDIV